MHSAAGKGESRVPDGGSLQELSRAVRDGVLGTALTGSPGVRVDLSAHATANEEAGIEGCATEEG